MGNMKIHQLVLIGVGGIIGAGFFLGSGLPIQLAGPAVLVSLLIGAWVTAQVTGALTTLAANHPDVTSFQAFSERYLGAYVGYVQGWVYFVSSILAIASESSRWQSLSASGFQVYRPRRLRSYLQRS